MLNKLKLSNAVSIVSSLNTILMILVFD